MAKATFHLVGTAGIDSLLGLMREYYLFDSLDFDESRGRDAIRRFLAEESLGRVWFIKSDMEVVGYVILTFGFIVEFHGRHGVIDELFIRPEHRGRGYGGETIEFIEGVCRSMGILVLRLEVEKANTEAQHFYQQKGFTAHDRFLMTRLLS